MKMVLALADIQPVNPPTYKSDILPLGQIQQVGVVAIF